MRTKPHLDYVPTDWSAQCEAKCRKNGKRCPHRCNSQIPNTIASHNVFDGNQFSIVGKCVRLCNSHARSFWVRAKRLLTVALIDGGHLSPYNHYGYGSVVIAQDRLNFSDPDERIKIPVKWPVTDWCGNVPDELFERLCQSKSSTPLP